MVEEGVGSEVIVTLPKGEVSSGMAAMFAEYLEQNFEDFPAKRRLVRFRLLPMVLRATDRKTAVTLRFGRSFVSVEDGTQMAPIEYSAPFFILTKVASAQPLRAQELRQLRVRGALRHPVAAMMGALLLRTPASLYQDRTKRRA